MRNAPKPGDRVFTALALTGIILFKFPFSYQASNIGRQLDLIPLMGSFTHSGAFGWGEIGDNVLIFVPFGIYALLARILKNRTNGVLTVIFLALTLGALVFLTFLFLRSSSS